MRHLLSGCASTMLRTIFRRKAHGLDHRSSGPFLVVSIPRRWAGQVDMIRAWEAEAAVQCLFRAVLPNEEVVIRFTDGGWEWHYQADTPVRLQSQISPALHLLSTRWGQIEAAAVTRKVVA